MNLHRRQSAPRGVKSIAACPPLERQTLALDALSKLTRQFCDKPDFEELISVLLMTICGQFSVADSFALLRKPRSHALSQSFFATGRFRNNVLLPSLQLTPNDWRHFSVSGLVWRAGRLRPLGESDQLISILEECGVTLVCPLIQSEDFFGIIGLANRVTGKPFEQDDVDLLGTIVSTVTPLVANSYLFWDIASLNAWYLDILNSVRQGVFVFDRHYRLKKVNTAGLGILKTFASWDFTRGTPVDAPVEAVFPESVFGGWARQIAQSGGAKQGTMITNVIARARDTERIYNVGITGTVENAEMGTALIITLDDVTVEKENEQRLFDLQKLADKGFLASSISHELNNFLALILAGVDLMQAAIDRGDTDKTKATIDKLRSNITNMARFTKGLTDYALPDSCKQTGSLNSVITDVLSFLAVQKRFKQIAIGSDLDSSLPDLEIDPDQIAQLLLNLLNNAADAITESGRDDGRINIRTIYDNGEAVLVISDNGAGMDSQVRERIFKSHFTTKQSGHGYGLTTCATLVGNHGGSITVDSRVGAGTTFTIRLPICP